MTGKNTDFADRLRKNNIPAQGISVYEGDKWKKEDYDRICLGHNYFVPQNDLTGILLKVFRENRLITEDETLSAEDLGMKIARLETKEDMSENEYDDIISVLSITTWFCETIRLIRRY
ncbi:MAG: hypothetical protein GY749_14445 [Desulfobacteraceae bacterium]|nr:hypothetical protein [Desulfobacteraceae bacterium]